MGKRHACHSRYRYGLSSNINEVVCSSLRCALTCYLPSEAQQCGHQQLIDGSDHIVIWFCQLLSCEWEVHLFQTWQQLLQQAGISTMKLAMLDLSCTSVHPLTWLLSIGKE